MIPLDLMLIGGPASLSFLEYAALRIHDADGQALIRKTSLQTAYAEAILSGQIRFAFRGTGVQTISDIPRPADGFSYYAFPPSGTTAVLSLVGWNHDVVELTPLDDRLMPTMRGLVMEARGWTI